MNRLHSVVNYLCSKGYSIVSTSPLSGGINSSVFELLLSDGTKLVLKLYPISSNSRIRNRGECEINFYQYLLSSGVSNVPVLVDFDSDYHWSLISWLSGKRLVCFNNDELFQVASFIRDLNTPKYLHHRQLLEPASDSCCSLPQVLDSINRRFLQFQRVNPQSQVERDALSFIHYQIYPYYQLFSDKLLALSNSFYWSKAQLLPVASPSDIGIHNLLSSSGLLYFFDFEYAGLDDLSKLVTDFVIHPEFPLSDSHFHFFVDSISSMVPGADNPNWLKRVNDLLNIFVAKWSLILLNDLHSNTLTFSKFKKSESYFHFMINSSLIPT